MDAVRYLLEHGFKINKNKHGDMHFSKWINQTLVMAFLFEYSARALVVGFARLGMVEFCKTGNDIVACMNDAIRTYNKCVIGNNLARCVLLNEDTIEPMKTSDGLPIMADD